MNTCHHCPSTNVIKKGFAGSGKQRCLCKTCQRTFVVGRDNWNVSPSKKGLIDRLLLERLSLRGICRVTGVPLRWLMDYMEEKYEGVPDYLNFSASLEKVREEDRDYLKPIDCQPGGPWSFVGGKRDRQYVWTAMHTGGRQVIAFHVGDPFKAIGTGAMGQNTSMGEGKRAVPHRRLGQLQNGRPRGKARMFKKEKVHQPS